MDVGLCFREAFEIYKKNVGVLVVAALLVDVLGLLTLVEFALHLAPMAIPYVGFIFGWFITPIGWLVIASAYAQIVASQKLPLSDEEVRSPHD